MDIGEWRDISDNHFLLNFAVILKLLLKSIKQVFLFENVVLSVLQIIVMQITYIMLTDSDTK